jgi:antitoxin Phd
MLRPEIEGMEKNMSINLENLVSIEQFLDNTNDVLQKVDKNGQVVILYKNSPAYVISKPNFISPAISASKPTLKLHEAMEIVLKDIPTHTMHAADLADEIYKRGLYFKKNGAKAEYTQISARANNYKDWFEKIAGNEIKLVRRT